MTEQNVAEFRARLSAALTHALKKRDSQSIDVLRTLAGAIANAEAVPVDETRYVRPKIGAGMGETMRLRLSMTDLSAIVEEEIAERTVAAAQYDVLGKPDEARTLREQAEILVRFLRGS